MLQRGALVDIQGHRNETCLFAASKFGHEKVVDSLIANGASISLCDVDGMSPLMIAIRYERYGAAKLLLAAGGDINGMDVQGNSMLLRAAFTGRIEMLTFIIANGADLHSANASKETAIILAVKSRQADACKLLISKGIDVNATDVCNRSALICACMSKHPDMANLLLLDRSGSRADLDIVDTWGYTALMFAAKCPALYDVLMQLIEYGASVNIQDRQFNTALFHACMNQNIKSAVYLLMYGGADSKLTNENNNYACDYLSNEEDRDMYKESAAKSNKEIRAPKMGYRKKPDWVYKTSDVN